ASIGSNWLLLGNSGATGVVYMTGGQLVSPNTMIGWNGNNRGEFTLAGGTMTVTGNMLGFNNGGGATATNIFNLNGGVFSGLGMEAWAAGGYDVVNFNGGPFQANSSRILMGTGAGQAGSLTAAYIYGGGLNLDTQGNNGTISQNLLAPT